jgi:hypothetical protein
MHTRLLTIVIVAVLSPLAGSALPLAGSVCRRSHWRSVQQTAATSGTRENGRQQKYDCVTFKSRGRLRENEPFSAKLMRGLEVRLVAEGQYGWQIVVNPVGDKRVDYVWPVSPPYQTAPQLKLGPGYGLTAAESVGFKRELRFTLTTEDYRTAFDAASRGPRDTHEVEEMLRRLRTGTLALEVTGFSVRTFANPNGTTEDGLAWIAFKGQACVPR